MRRHITFSAQLTACLLAFTVLPLLLFSVIFFPTLNDNLFSARMDGMERVSVFAASNLDEAALTLMEQSQALAAQPTLSAMLAGNHGTSFLAGMVGGQVTGAALFDADGQYIASAGNVDYSTLNHEAFLAVAKGGLFAASSLMEGTALTGQSIYLAAPVTQNGAIACILVQELQLHLPQVHPYAQSSAMMVVDQSGMILYHTDKAQAGTQLANDSLMSLFVSYQSGQQEMSGQGVTNISGVRECYAYSILSNLPWMLVSHQSQSVLTSQGTLLMIYALLAVVGLALLALIISRIASRSVTFPLKRLNTAFYHAGHNQFKPLTPSGPAEFYQLAEGYNEMIALLDNNMQWLSKSNRYLFNTIAQMEFQQDQILLLHETPETANAIRGTVEVNLVSGHMTGSGQIMSMLGLTSGQAIDLTEYLRKHGSDSVLKRFYQLTQTQADQIHEILPLTFSFGQVWLQVHGLVFYNTDGKPTTLSVALTDMTSAHAPDNNALTDNVTGLATLFSFQTHLRELYAQSPRPELMVAAISIGGREALPPASILLAQRITADRLRSFVAPDGMAASIDKNTYLVLLPLEEDNRERLEALKQQLITTINLSDCQVSPVVSIGACLSSEIETAEELIDFARKSLPKKGGISLHTPDQKDSRQLLIEKALTTCLVDNALVMEYQPILRIDTQQVMGFEGTVRLQTKELGLISAGELLPIAEGMSMMVPLSQWIVNHVCRFAVTTRKEQQEDYFFSINVSREHLIDPTFADSIYLALKESGLPGNALQLEFSEARLMDIFLEKVDSIKALRQLGVRIALDDYGAATSDLHNLYNMPLDVLKIDRSFLVGISASPGKEFILKTLMDIAHSLHLDVIAVGVEHHTRLHALIDLHCDMAQGYHFCPPLPPATLAVWLDTRSEH